MITPDSLVGCLCAQIERKILVKLISLLNTKRIVSYYCNRNIEVQEIYEYNYNGTCGHHHYDGYIYSYVKIQIFILSTLFSMKNKIKETNNRIFHCLDSYHHSSFTFFTFIHKFIFTLNFHHVQFQNRCTVLFNLMMISSL